MPTSARHKATADHNGNQVGMMTVPVTANGDPHQLRTTIAHTSRNRKPANPSTSAVLLRPALRLLARAGTTRWFVDR